MHCCADPDTAVQMETVVRGRNRVWPAASAVSWKQDCRCGGQVYA